MLAVAPSMRSPVQAQARILLSPASGPAADALRVMLGTRMLSVAAPALLLSMRPLAVAALQAATLLGSAGPRAYCQASQLLRDPVSQRRISRVAAALQRLVGPPGGPQASAEQQCTAVLSWLVLLACVAAPVVVAAHGQAAAKARRAGQAGGRRSAHGSRARLLCSRVLAALERCDAGLTALCTAAGFPWPALEQALRAPVLLAGTWLACRAWAAAA